MKIDNRKCNCQCGTFDSNTWKISSGMPGKPKSLKTRLKDWWHNLTAKPILVEKYIGVRTIHRHRAFLGYVDQIFVVYAKINELNGKMVELYGVSEKDIVWFDVNAYCHDKQFFVIKSS